MITEIVTFRLPQGMTREEALAAQHTNLASQSRPNPQGFLVRRDILSGWRRLFVEEYRGGQACARLGV